MVFANNLQRFELGCLRKYNMVLIISPAVFLLPFLTTLIEFWSYVFIYIFFFAGHITDCELLIKFFDKWINTFCHCFNISFSMFVFMIGWYFSCLQNLTHFVQFFFSISSLVLCSFCCRMRKSFALSGNNGTK